MAQLLRGYLWATLVLVMPIRFAQAQITSTPGSLLIVGGGSETPGGWSDAPYEWAIDQSTNRRVIILGLAAASNFLPDYFLQLGATSAKNLTITPTEANLQATYDTLMAHDVIFIRGGDQWDYYQAWNNTLTEDAIRAKFNAGQVVGGTSAGAMILSGVWFSAENGTVYPWENLQDYNNPYNTLRTDFLALVPGVLFDTHVAERGRMGRMLGFIEKHQTATLTELTGIGVDDKTALCIPNNSNNWRVFGTGAVGVYAGSYQTGIHTVQVLGGDSISIPSLQPVGLGNSCLFHVDTLPAGPVLPRLFMAGSDDPATNQQFRDSLVLGKAALAPNPSNPDVWIVTGSDSTLAQQWAASIATVQGTSSQLVTPFSIGQAIGPESKRVLYVGLSPADWSTIVAHPQYDSLAFTTRICAAAGRACQLVGRWGIDTETNSAASYEGELQMVRNPRPLATGLDNFIVIPNAFPDSSDFLENVATCIPWAMAQDSNVWYGLLLSPGAYAERQVWDIWDGLHYFLTTASTMPAFTFGGGGMGLPMLGNTMHTCANTTVSVDILGTQFRNIGGGQHWIFLLSANGMDNDVDVHVGSQLEQLSGLPGESSTTRASWLTVYPNPTQNEFALNGLVLGQSATATLHDQLGRTVCTFPDAHSPIRVQGLPSGVYVLKVTQAAEQYALRIAIQ